MTHNKRPAKPPERTAVQWPELLDRFREHLVSCERAPKTIEGYLGDLGRFQLWAQERQIEPADLESDQLLAWKQGLLDAKRLPQAINRPLAALRQLVKWAKPLGMIPELRVPRFETQETPRPKWLEQRQRNALLREVAKSDPLDGAIVVLLLDAGLRVSELVSLTWGAVAISERKGELTVVGKGRKRRTIHLSREARALLEAHKETCAALPTDQVVGLGPRAIERRVERLGRRARVEPLSPHDLRHTFCRRLAESGSKLQEIASLAGHTSLETTRRYVEPGAEDLARAVEAASALDRPEPSRQPAGRPKRGR